MSDLRIEFGFRTPLTRPDHPIHLDSVLLYANIFAGVPENDARALLDRAIETYGEGEDRVYCASALFFDIDLSAVRFRTRRISVENYSSDIQSGLVRSNVTNQINTSRGEVKGMLQEIPIMWASKGTAWARIKDMDALGELLSRTNYVGKYSMQGYGQIGSVDVFESEDPDAWQRRLLAHEVPGSAKLHATISPPYFDRSRQRIAYMHPYLLDHCYG
jgi:CRISPR type IV-associated protein Csf3